MLRSGESLGRWMPFVALALATSVGCGSSSSSFSDGGMDATHLMGGNGGNDGGPIMKLGGDSGSGLGTPDVNYGADAFFATDPPPKYCGFDGGAPPMTPGGTPMCPSDKNREGCPCPGEGMTAACWPGLRVDRGIGQCKDGTTTCTTTGEGLMQVWGPCVGYVLPTAGASAGAPACKCFSSGQWNLSNLSPCFINYSSGQTYAVSSTLSGNTINCPSGPDTPPPVPAAGVPWSTDTLKVDCEGQFTLCYTIKAGSAMSPSPSDCVVGQACVSGDYTTANQVQAFPPLPGWVGADPACAAQFESTGGYGEMTVRGLSEYCEPIGAMDGGAPAVFNRVSYCPAACQTNPMAAGCANCQSGGSGMFGG